MKWVRAGGIQLLSYGCFHGGRVNIIIKVTVLIQWEDHLFDMELKLLERLKVSPSMQ